MRRARPKTGRSIKPISRVLSLPFPLTCLWETTRCPVSAVLRELEISFTVGSRKGTGDSTGRFFRLAAGVGFLQAMAAELETRLDS